MKTLVIILTIILQDTLFCIFEKYNCKGDNINESDEIQN